MKHGFVYRRREALAAPLLIASLLTACGGGGDSASTDFAGAPLTGTVAIGAAAQGFQVAVIDRTGASACTEPPAATALDGTYGCPLRSGLQAPLAIVASDPAGLLPPMVSLLPSLPAAGATATAHVSPLTTAIAAQMDSNSDPLAFTREPAKLADLSTSNLAAVTRKLVDQLAAVLASLNVDAEEFDPFTTPFVAGSGEGVDALLDQIRVSFEGGEPHLSNVLNPDAPAVPLADASTDSPPLLGTSLAGDFALSELDIFKTEMERCFALPAAERAPNPDAANLRLTDVAPACDGFVASAGDTANVDTDFLNNGYGAEAYFYSLFTSADMDGARFNRPELMRYVKLENGRDEAVLNIKFIDGKGVPGNRILLAKKFPDSRAQGAPQWWLIGNQRPIDASVQLTVRRREQAIPASILDASSFFDNAARSRYEVGFSIFVHRPNNGGTVTNPNNPNGAVRYVRVKGPGLPDAGLVFADVAPSLPQNWMNLLNASGTIPVGAAAELAGSAGNVFFIQRTRGLSGQAALTQRPNPGVGQASIAGPSHAHPLMYGQQPDANWIFDVSVIKGWSQYRVEAFCGTDPTPCHDFTTRILTPLIPATSAVNLPWHSFAAQSLTALSDGAPASSELPIAWSPDPLAERVSSVQAYSWSPDGPVNSASTLVAAGEASRTVAAVGGLFPALSYNSNQHGISLQLRYQTHDGSSKHHFRQFN